MKKITLFIALLLTAGTGFSQVYDPNNYGIIINSVNEASEASVTLPNGSTFIVKAIVNPTGKSRGRMTGRGFIMDIPIMPQSMEWNSSQGKNVPVGLRYNEAGGFTAYTATAYYVEGYKGSDNKMHYTVQQAVGSWAAVPNAIAWVTWYADQPQPIKSYYRVVNVYKELVTENQQRYTIGL